MSIIDRIRRIAQANIHGLLDRADTPEMALREKIEELGNAIGEAKQALAGYAVSCKRMEIERDKSGRAADQWGLNAEEALRTGRESAARNAIALRIRARERALRLGGMLEQSRGIYDRLKENLVVLGDELRAARLRLSELETRKRAAGAQKAFGGKLDRAMGVPGGGIDFSALEDEVLQAEMEVEIDREVRTDMAAIDREIELKTVESLVDSEMAALKEKLGRAG